MQNFLVGLLEPKANGPEAALLLAKLLDVKISGSTLKKEIEEHPNYPSLLSISDVLNSYGIENIGIKFNPDKLAEMPLPFITQIKGEKSIIDFFTVVKKIDDDRVHFFDPEAHIWSTIPHEDFMKRCSGIALLAEVGDYAGEKDYHKKIKLEKQRLIAQYFLVGFIPALVIIAGAIAFRQTGGAAFLPFIFSMLTLAGALIGVLLLFYELDSHNPVLKQICGAGKKVNCGAVLQSKASTIAGISWSALGFTYFMGMLLLLLSSAINNPTILFVVSFINFIAVPYTIFSIYYQWRVAKQWCVLCLGVQALLILQLITVLTGGWYALIPFNAINAGLIIQTIIAFAIPFIATVILVPALKKAKEGKRYNTELQKLKHNPQIFEALLRKQKEANENVEGIGITLGNPDGRYKLIKVCNPYCGPCASAHQPIEDLLHNNPDLQVQIIFTATNNEGDKKTPPVKHLLAIAEKSDEEIVKRALDDWYLADTKDYELFAAKYPLNGELKQQDQKIAAMENWCAKTEINVTPTFFIAMPDEKGSAKFHQLPRLYSVQDLKYFLSV